MAMLSVNQINGANLRNQVILFIEPRIEASYYQWLTLLKPRVLVLVVFTGICGILLAPGHSNPFLDFISILCISTASGACGAINMWFDRDIDAVMRRTCFRPIPAGKLAPNQVLAFGIILAVGSVLLMGLALNMFATCILMTSIIFYLIVYTGWLKRRTPQNIVIGGAAGAFPPVIGWASVTGNVEFMPLLMFTIIFFWTPPHFWCLALWTKDDYTKADVPMLPITAGELHTRKLIIWYTIILIFLSEAPIITDSADMFYTLIASAIGCKYIFHTYNVLNDYQDNGGKSLSGDAPAKRAFRYSIWYLFSLFGFLVIDRLLR